MEDAAYVAPTVRPGEPSMAAPPETVSVTLQPQPVLVTSETAWLPLALSLVPAFVAAIATYLIWKVNRQMLDLQRDGAKLQQGMLHLQKGMLSLQATTADLESRPALQVMVEQAKRECPQEPGTSEIRWQQLTHEQKFRGILITNKGRGPAVLESLHYPGAEIPLKDAHLPMHVTAFFECPGLIKALLVDDSKDCFILYADPLHRKHRQYFGINLKDMTAVPLRCEDA